MSTAMTERSSTLPKAVADRGVDEAQWLTLTNSLFPGAKPESVLMVIDYCRARRLDPMKKPCHIVPMKVKDQKSGEWGWRDVVMPGIYEYRTTAMRTGQYAGHSQPEYGPLVEYAGVTAPEWCAMTIYRRHGHERIEFPVRVYFREAAQTKQDGKANDRWSKAPIQMLTKVCEAAGLREAFPDEFGGEMTAEEMDGQVVGTIDEKPVIQQPQRKSESSGPAPSQPPVHAEPAASGPSAPLVGVRVLDAERRRSEKTGANYWIVLGDRSDQDYFFLPETGEHWEQLVEAVKGLKGTTRRVEFDTVQPEGQKWPTITGITPVGGEL